MQGKESEKTFGLNRINFGARTYNPTSVVWDRIDPLADKMPFTSPFNYNFNNPLRFIDKDGRIPDIVITGANNSSVTVKTDLIDIKVNASGLGVNFGGNYTLSGNDVLGAALDVVGVFDPTGIADGLNAGLQAKSGDYIGAAISTVGLIPYAGDVAKVGKIEKDVKIIGDAVDALSKAEKRASALSAVGREGKKFTKAGKEAVIDLDKAQNGGKTICKNCGIETIPAIRDTRGVAPPKNRTEIDHINRKRDGGSGTPDNGRVLCSDCNKKKG